MSCWFACCSCIPATPVDDDPRKGNANKWHIDMAEAPKEEFGWCLYGCMCPWCATYQLRKRALNNDMSNYACCQRYFTFCCVTPGNMGEDKCPECCLCLEVCCCLGCAVSATRFHIMDQYGLVSDPCDNRIIRFNNCIQVLSCIISLLSICISELRDAAFVIDLIAKCVFLSTVGCMSAQQKAELEFRAGQGQMGGGQQAPPQMEMSRQGQEGAQQQTEAQVQYVQAQQQGQNVQQYPVAEAKPMASV